MTLDLGSGRDAPSALRHDLATLVNHILGYCEILIEDAEERRNIYRARSVRSVQDLGRLALDVIDRALTRAVEGGRPVEVIAMGHALISPCSAVIEACMAIEEASGRSPDRSALVEDLARIREAAGQLLDVAREMAGEPGAGPA